MVDWTDIQNVNLEPGAPALSSTVFAFRDNPIAIAEGAVGAPRIVNGALAGYPFKGAGLKGPTAGSLLGIRLQYPDDFTNASLLVAIYKGGTVRLAFEHSSSINGESSSVRVYKNGSQITSYTTTSFSYTQRTIDISVASGDYLRVQGVAGGTAAARIQNASLNVSEAVAIFAHAISFGFG